MLYEVLIDNRSHFHKPLFSVIIALYNVEDYVRAAIKSLTMQNIDPEKLEFIVVDDASVDKSRDIARQWAEKDKRVVLVAMQKNLGVAAARNVALSLSHGTWVTTVDPDDLVAEDYFAEVSRCISADTHDVVSMYSARCLITNDHNGNFKDSHPLGKKYAKGNRVVSLNETPNDFSMGATTFLRREVLEEHSLTFDERVRPAFEDGHLIARYLCQWDNPVHGLVATAVYYYRKRATGNSLVQSGWANPDKYTAQVKNGYLDVINYAKLNRGCVPDWLACQILYDLVWYFKEWESNTSQARRQSSEVLAEFMEYIEELVADISLEQLNLLRVNQPSFKLRQVFELGLWKSDKHAQLTQCTQTPQDGCRYTLDVAPDVGAIEILINDNPISVVPDGVREYSYFGRILMREYAFTLPVGDVKARVDGEFVSPDPVHSHPGASVTDGEIQKVNAAIMCVKKHRSVLEKYKRRIQVKSLILKDSELGVVTKIIGRRIRSFVLKDSGSFKKKYLKRKVSAYAKAYFSEFQDTWLIIDHENRADDNGEHFYRYIAKNHPEINVYFVLSKASKDWNRLAAEGFRLLEYGSIRTYAAAQCAKLVISSDAIAECMYLAPRNIFGMPTYSFVFLQHGVTINDISAWLNPKRIALITAATKEEADVFVWKNSGYSFTAQNVALTGFSRFDALYERRLAELESAVELPKSVFIMPTWRRKVYLDLLAASNDEERYHLLNKKSYLAYWIRLLNSKEIASLAKNGVVRFALHPNLRGYEHLIDLPEYVVPVVIDDVSIQDMIFDSGLFLTDYSSLAVDFALAERRVCYLQFAGADVETGAHSWNPGYFDYIRDGFGPVFTDVNCGADIVDFLLGLKPEWDQMAAERRASLKVTFDGKASQRIMTAVSALIDGTLQPYSVCPPAID